MQSVQLGAFRNIYVTVYHLEAHVHNDRENVKVFA